MKFHWTQSTFNQILVKTKTHMNRRLFVQKSLLLLAFASTYNYAKERNLLPHNPNKNLDKFFTGIRALSLDYFNEIVDDSEWRIKLNDFYVQYFYENDAIDMRKYIDFNKLKKRIEFKDKGRGSVIVDTPLTFKNEKLKLKTKLIGIQKGYAIPPHIHENMASASLILKGKMLVSHYNRLETNKDFVLVEKDSEHYQKPGDWSIVSPVKNNLHWFKSYQEDSYMLNINVEGLNNLKAKPGIRVDIERSNSDKNLFKAIIISDKEAQAKYGKL